MVNFLVGLLVIIGALVIALLIMFFAGMAVIVGFSLIFLLKFFVGLFIVVLVIWFIGKMARSAFGAGKQPPPNDL